MNPLIVIDGVSVRRDQSGRYCLNDLHRAAGGLSKHQPSNWMRLDSTLGLIDELSRSSNLRNGHPVTDLSYVYSPLNPVNVIRGGTEQGTYVSKELVYAYAMWISASFSLRVIRTFDSVMASVDTGHANDLVQAGVTLLGFMQSSLNLSNSSVLGACQKLQAAVGLPDLAPSYAIDAPAGSMDGSSRPTMALSTILKNRGINVRITEAYRRLESLGLVERRSRPSSSARAKNGRREFWCVSHRGLSFGKNITSPNNPRETQPHFYESRVDELLSMMLTASAV
ncbi:KilA-N domain-containing protein [Lonsdalea quercina]|uniref:KilA-N domain-containing protein n=1 Tax=Lonsdalea quercina TaxID=71657 RepID=UPI0039767872